MKALVNLLVTQVGTLETLVAVLLFVHTLPRRRAYPLRLLGFFLALDFVPVLTFGACAAFHGNILLGPCELSFLTLASSLGTLCVMALGAWWCHGIDRWSACAAAVTGYTMQNIASSTVNFWRFTLGQNGAGDLFDSEALFAQAQKAPVNLMAGPQSTVSAPSFLLSLATFAGVYLTCYLVFIRRIEHEDLGSRGSVWQLVLMTLVGTLVISFDIANKLLTVTDASFGLQLSYRLMHGLMCGFLLWVEYRLLYAQRIADEKAAAEALLDAGARQYELARETVAAIDRRCHDLRHLVLRQLSEGGTGADGSVRIDRSQLARVAREIDVYDMRAKTGNEALDVILTEKALLARQRGVSLECMVDGSALAAVSPADLYALVGCLVDSSVDAAAESDDSTVLLSSRRQGALYLLAANIPGNTVPSSTMLDQARSVATRLGGTLTIGPGQARILLSL